MQQSYEKKALKKSHLFFFLEGLNPLLLTPTPNVLPIASSTLKGPKINVAGENFGSPQCAGDYAGYVAFRA